MLVSPNCSANNLSRHLKWCDYRDTWLSDQLGKSVFSLPSNLELYQLTELLNHLPSEPAMLSTKTSTTDTELSLMLQCHGFALIDTGIELTANSLGQHAKEDSRVRLACDDDAEQVQEIAATSFEQNRFHLDPNIPSEIAASIKQQWVANYFCGQRGDQLFVLEAEQEIQGFLLLLKRDEGWIIDLIAVARCARSQGVATRLIQHAAHHIDSSQAWRVGTQLSNPASLGLYQKLGFSLTRAHYLYHRHIGTPTHEFLD